LCSLKVLKSLLIRRPVIFYVDSLFPISWI
jgi:hypothetical protein